MAIIPRSRSETGSALSTTRGTVDPFEMMREMMRWEPFRELAGITPSALVYSPSFDVKETKDSYVFKADLPGIKEDDVEISLTDNRLVISGKRDEEERLEGEQLYAYERSYGSFSRAFTLPVGIDAEQVRAEMKDGVLTVVVPKKPEAQPKRILLKAGAPADQKKAKA